MIFKRAVAGLRAQDWSAILIELCIVIIGVFIGTQVSNWNQDRIARREAQKMLIELKPGLNNFLDFFSTARTYYGTTGRYAATAFAGWRGDRKVNDEQFVIAAYQASQIYTLGVNAVNWTRIFGGDRLDDLDDPVLHGHLADLMTFNFDQIDTAAVSTSYREHVRQVIPDDIQEAIRAECSDQPIPGKPLWLQLPSTCSLNLPAVQWKNAAAALRNHPELPGELSWHRSAIANFLGSIDLFDRQTRLVMSDLEKLRV